VFGRGGPRGPPDRPKYLSQTPPNLSYTIGSILKGNPFSILALDDYEKSFVQPSSAFNEKTFPPKAVVHKDKIPDSIDTSQAPKSLPTLKQAAPVLYANETSDSCGKYTTVIRGRSQSNYFNKKVSQS